MRQTFEERLERRRRETFGSREERSHWQPTDWERQDASDDVLEETPPDQPDWERQDHSDDVLESATDLADELAAMIGWHDERIAAAEAAVQRGDHGAASRLDSAMLARADAIEAWQTLHS